MDNKLNQHNLSDLKQTTQTTIHNFFSVVGRCNTFGIESQKPSIKTEKRRLNSLNRMKRNKNIHTIESLKRDFGLTFKPPDFPERSLRFPFYENHTNKNVNSKLSTVCANDDNKTVTFMHTIKSLEKDYGLTFRPPSMLKRELPFPVVFSDDQNAKIYEISKQKTEEVSVHLNARVDLQKPDHIDVKKSHENSPSLEIEQFNENPQLGDKELAIIEHPQMSTQKENSALISSKTTTEFHNNHLDPERFDCASPKSLVANTMLSPTTDDVTTINWANLNAWQSFVQSALSTPYFKKLLTSQDIDILHAFKALEQKFQYFCMKLYLRQVKWYDIMKLCAQVHLEMSTVEILQMYKVLVDLKAIRTDFIETQSTDELLNLLEVRDLKDVCKYFRIKVLIRHKKSDIIENLKNTFRTQNTLKTASPSSLEDIVKKTISGKLGYCVMFNDNWKLCFDKVFILHTFTTHGMDTLNDYFFTLSKCIEYPSYVCEEYDIFKTPTNFCLYVQARTHSIDFRKHSEKKDKNRMLELALEAERNLKKSDFKQCSSLANTLPYHEQFTAPGQYARTLSSACKILYVQEFERVSGWLQVLLGSVYCKRHRGTWFNLLILIHFKYLKKPKECIQMIKKYITLEHNILDDVQLHELRARWRKILSRSQSFPKSLSNQITSILENLSNDPPASLENIPTSTVISRTMRNNQCGHKRLYPLDDGDGGVTYLSVEQVALNYYANGADPADCYGSGVHCEGGIICTLFVLLFWDIIYGQCDQIKGVFVGKCQTAPLDFFTTCFYKQRSTIIDKRLLNIESGWSNSLLRNFITTNFQNHQLEMTIQPLTAYASHPEDLLAYVDCMGRIVLARILKRLVRNYRIYSNGFPDLFVWDVGRKQCKFVEVKGEGDTVACNQLLWLNYLYSVSAPVEICYVHSVGSKRHN